MNEALRAELLALQEADLAMRRQLIDEGALYGKPPAGDGDGYDQRMADVHRRNNARLAEILAAHGWPGVSLVGAEAAEAAWKVAQHAILDPALQQRALELLTAAAHNGEAPHWQRAMLTDRVLMERGEPQLYGSIHVGGPDGGLVPWPIAEPELVDQRRAAAGMPPLAEHAERLRGRVERETAIQEQARRAPGQGDGA